MSEFTYDDIAADVAEFANYDVDSSAINLRGIINRATRYVGNWQSGRWKSLYIRDKAVSIDSTGYLITLPTDYNNIGIVHRTTLERNQYRRWVDYDVSVEQPTDLIDEPTRKINFYYKQSEDGNYYVSYWRKVKEFATSADQVPDIRQSGEAISEVAKWLAIRNERGTNANEKLEQQAMAENTIRALWGRDIWSDEDTSAPYASVDYDRYYGMTNYDLSAGGDAIVGSLRRGVVMDRNYGG